ncbi:MAG: hypothetical protein A2X94_00135 [Bdellovibrionales bacterium GWB1_55_8]|nr:MAG: hypothetical protein A2X94_00135 [Bdellovibrionales bacterium GWB1_55_8]
MKSNLLSAIPGLVHGFGTLSEPVPEALAPAWEKKPEWHQVHGVRAAEVLYANQKLGDCDAVYSAAPGIPVAIQTADCVPILLARRDGRAVAAVHAGWRGTKSRILRELWKQLSVSGERPEDWVAAIGPAIGPCCYKVSPELAAEFAAEFSSFGKAVAVPKPEILDLPAINVAELRAIGIPKIDLIRSCTFCATSEDGSPRSHSYRREKIRTRQYSGLMIAPPRVPFSADTF